MKAYLEPEEITLMEKAATCFRDRLPIRLLFRLGCRISEALALKVKDVDFAQGTVTIQHFKSRLRLSCPECGARLGWSHTFCPGCSAKVEEALATKGEAPQTCHRDIVEIIESLGVKLKRAGKEYVGLCPFHDDHSPSLSVNREKGVWKCHSTRCGKAGTAEQFVKEWQQIEAHGDEQGREEHIRTQESHQWPQER